jgi:hypothetical protein
MQHLVDGSAYQRFDLPLCSHVSRLSVRNVTHIAIPL